MYAMFFFVSLEMILVIEHIGTEAFTSQGAFLHSLDMILTHFLIGILTHSTRYKLDPDPFISELVGQDG